YGITNDKANYDDYAAVEVDNKIVIVIRGSPKGGDTERNRELMKGAPLLNKIVDAEKHGAAAVLIVNDADTARDGDDLLDFNYTSFIRRTAKRPVCHVRRSVLEMMLPGGADILTTLETDINRELRPHSCELPGWTVSVSVKIHRGTIDVKNVV